MKKYEILYDWPISHITHLADSNEAEQFADGLDSALIESFTALTERMRGLGADLASAKASRMLFDKWVALRECIDSFESDFSAFPHALLRKFRLYVLLAEKLTQVAPSLDAIDVDENTFEIVSLPQGLPLAWFARENSQSLSESMAVFSDVDMVTLEQQFAPYNLSPEFTFAFLGALSLLPDVAPAHSALIRKSASNDLAAIESFVRMLIISTGAPVHSARRYTNIPSVLDPDLIKVGNVYQQWGDVLTVLSEYNSRDEILIKYLTIYHVVENFMFKLPIVSLEQKQDGRMFSIRDFQRLYKKVDISESEALNQLFEIVFKMPATPGVTFKQHVIARWNMAFPSASQSAIDGALQALGLSVTHATFCGQQVAQNFARLIYSLRNAIVHNKETEFHLTYESMDVHICSILEEFLMPVLEEICFHVIGSRNAALWYKNKEMVLYK